MDDQLALPYFGEVTRIVYDNGFSHEVRGSYAMWPTDRSGTKAVQE